MKNGWPTKKLAEVIIDIKDGGTPSRKNPRYFGGDIYWCVVKDIKPLICDTAEKLTEEGLKNCSAKVWPVDSVIISLGATIGQIGIAKVPTATKQGLAGIVVNKKMMTPEFLAYGLLDQKEYIQSIATGATIREIRPTRFAETIRLLVPPIPEQQRIVGILDEALEGVAKAKESAQRNLQNARALFESHLYAVFTNRGAGWVTKPLAELCDPSRVITYGVIKLGDEVPAGVPCLRTSNVRWLRIDTKGMKRIAPALSSEYSRTVLRGGEVLVNVRGTLGGVAVAAQEMAGWNVSREVAVVPIDSSRADPAFVSFAVASVASQQWLGDVKKGAAYVGINIEDLRLLPVSIPRLENQAEIVRRLKNVQDEARQLESLYQQRLSALDALKKSFLDQAFSGKL